MMKLLTVTRGSAKSMQRMSPEQRSRAYSSSYLTDLRKKEKASLTAASFRLDDSPPTVALAAACSKHRCTDVLPLHPQLVSMLRGWLTELPAGAKFFAGSAKKMSGMIQNDLKRAGMWSWCPLLPRKRQGAT